MPIVSKTTSGTPPPSSRSGLLSSSLQRTYLCFSLEHCFPPHQSITLAIQNKKCLLKTQLAEIPFEREQQVMEQYYRNGSKELCGLTEYYKYYTQTSLTHLPGFARLMHSHREQRKGVEYNRLKKILQLSNSTLNDSSKAEVEESTSSPSICILQQLNLTNRSQESVMLQKLRCRLQQDFGPNHYHTLQQIDKQYYFTKKIGPAPAAENCNFKSSFKLASKQGSDRYKSAKHSAKKKRNNSCEIETFNCSGKQIKGKLKRKKNCSMDNLNAMTRQSSMRGTKSHLTAQQTIQFQVKQRIMGVKERIRKQKQLLLKKCEQVRVKKYNTIERANKKLRH